ncbi:deoxyguanosinetriphosphate triphosphohydrolase, partial [Candidatus Endoriftia persephone str. Guaymas]|nr:deoxyguanosinetriphosphate triphosphohydrolase [Candidatus Endoriftia persephone str. Guaymas]
IGSGRFDGVSAKKPGFTAEDREHFEMVAQSVGLIRRDPMLGIWYRHPLAFLVEAADDICYRVIDIEDGYRVGHLSFESALDLYLSVLNQPDKLKQRLNGIIGDKEKIEFLRAKVINQTI